MRNRRREEFAEERIVCGTGIGKLENGRRGEFAERDDRGVCGMNVEGSLQNGRRGEFA